MTIAPGLEGIHKAWAGAEAEDAYWREHYSRLLEQCRDHFVTVHDNRFVATSTDLQEILRLLDTRRLDPRCVWIRFVTADTWRVRPTSPAPTT